MSLSVVGLLGGKVLLWTCKLRSKPTSDAHTATLQVLRTCDMRARRDPHPGNDAFIAADTAVESIITLLGSVYFGWRRLADAAAED
jgi:hypothetical protein